ncbi:hypothetical protein [Spirosoma rhododendri]|uniref:Uncharacterized protein n=1 Tax=Spirosoma rhododendri TaxID=2728024 RepID=A0A7L5DS31_9BACT|nr:hypothetical protein [Spirosoma rhododendri]QJD79368.1 hypothetical protein HH216_13815 [Spirosoma rhododendri]
MINSTTTPLYKYLQKQHADDMVNLGRIRVGTLWDFKNEKAHGSVIGDQMEGYRQFNLTTLDGRSQTINDTIGGMTFKNVTIGGTGHLISFGDSAEHNYYMYCASAENSDVIQKAFSANAVVEITDVPAFYDAITDRLKVLKLASGDVIVDDCVYEQKQTYGFPQKGKVNYRKPVVPVWRQKDPTYAYQKEVRGIWVPTSPRSMPVIIEVPEIRTVCRLIDL